MTDVTGLTWVVNGVLTSVHPAYACRGRWYGCWVHDPLPWALATAPVRWRDDKGTAERVCEHGIGHPDLQDVAYNRDALGRDVTVHGCDGCCGPRPEWWQ